MIVKRCFQCGNATSGARCVFCGHAFEPGKPASFSRGLILAGALVVFAACFLLLNR